MLSAGEVVSSRVMTIATAAYTFIKVIMAIINIVRAKRWRDPVVQVVRNINLIDAFVSLLALETSMVAVFGDGTDKLIPLSATLGFVVFAGTVVMALHMIIKAGVELARIRKRTASSVKGDGNE